MKIEDQVCSLELANLIKEFGVPQESLFYWTSYNGLPFEIRYETDVCSYKDCTILSAYTVSELCEFLPLEIEIVTRISAFNKLDKKGEQVLTHNLWTHRNEDGWTVMYDNKNIIEDENQANAYAKMLINLIDNKFMEFPQ